MDAVLGIDGGGTNTRAAIMRGEEILGSAQNGSIKRLRVGADAAEANLRAVLKEVFAQAGVKGVRAASCGVASASMPGITEWITAVFNDFGVERSEVVGDHVIALDAAFQGGPGILQIAGTGTNTIGRAPDGGCERAGGWSSRLGDEGSGYWIGLHAIRRALKAYDREEPTQVLKKVGEIWGAPTLDELINLGDSTPGPDFAALAPAINELAEAGEVVAVEVLRQAAADLIENVLLVRAKLHRKHQVVGEVPVAWTGSVIGRMKIVREAFFAGLQAAAPQMPVRTTETVALDGALWRARRMASEGELSFPALAVFAQNAQHAALDRHLRGGHVDRIHLHIRRLQANHVAFGIEALERGLAAMNEGHHDLALAGGSRALHQHIIAIDDVLVAHGISAHFKSKHVAVADHVVQRDGFLRFRRFDRQAGGNAPGQRQLQAGARARAGRQQIDRPAAVMNAVEHPLLFKVGDVLVHGGQALEIHPAGDLFKRRRIAVASDKSFKEIDDFFLSACDSHAGIIANKKRTARSVFAYCLLLGHMWSYCAILASDCARDTYCAGDKAGLCLQQWSLSREDKQ